MWPNIPFLTMFSHACFPPFLLIRPQRPPHWHTLVYSSHSLRERLVATYHCFGLSKYMTYLLRWKPDCLCPQYRSRGGRFFSASTEDPASADSPDCAGKARASKQRWSGLFGNAKVYCCLLLLSCYLHFLWRKIIFSQYCTQTLETQNSIGIFAQWIENKPRSLATMYMRTPSWSVG